MKESTTDKIVANGPPLSSQPPSAFDSRWTGFQCCWAVAVLSLIAATWGLWFTRGEFPAVPMFDLPVEAAWLDVIAVGAIVVSLLAIAASAHPRRWLFGLLIGGLAMAFVSNQHRLQPWAYQALLHCVAFALLSPRSAWRWSAAISISIYFYSACGKFDYQFLHTVGQEFVARLIGPAPGAPDRLRLLLATALPATEVAVAITLCYAKTRRLAGLAAMVLHAGLLAVLGPWAWGHSAGVLLWNAWLIPLAWFLFVVPRPECGDGETARVPAWIARSILFAALLLPLLERSGYWDHWLSWSLYSPHTSRVEVELHQSVLNALPASARPFVSPDDDNDQWHVIAMDRWSLEVMAAPLYPQARFQLGVARALAATLPNEEAIRVKLKSVSNRFAGVRTERWLQGSDEIEAAATSYWLLARDAGAARRPGVKTEN